MTRQIVNYPGDRLLMTLPGPSRTIIVEPIEVPEDEPRAPEHEPREEPAPPSPPERERVPVEPATDE